MGEWKINLKNFCLACFDKTQNLLKEFYLKKIKFDIYKVSNWKVKIKHKKHLNFYREKIIDEVGFGFKLTCRIARLGYGFQCIVKYYFGPQLSIKIWTWIWFMKKYFFWHIICYKSE